MKLEVFQCKQCGSTLFPARYFCFECGGAEWRERAVEHGRVGELTTVRRRVGAQDGGDVLLASVTTDAGPTVIARLEGAVRTGDRVRVAVDEQNRVVVLPIA
ncbi:zinc ribbon domain-containing protein [Burkholderia multivorans]|uniref:Zn-ribbon domain-containing OB-fold protein n=1 Tax=Burkholderia multivorans TaxID=87883 RepID=UPI000CFEF718|nr:zinc ribbon domain-containing protein [Burkholderia multivorans]MBU9184431.1 rubredoxin [Burkholderia multivorans]MCL4663267.1 zinc ribbon domain-containing protein [Burkholderia multivorans]MCO1356780.1 zinc ribbon domain-containing protein [Burkholderia multivorans]MCO1415014.1 zinc ribbon domain-containing protein [Burkholderia multivorans]MCO1448956.1 zinc ribbon domain-containing protein [Burkholderia multivorans]